MQVPHKCMMDKFALIVFERQHYMRRQDLKNHVLQCVDQELEDNIRTYQASHKKIQQITHQDQLWLSCKSIHQFLSWYLDHTYKLCPDVATFRHDISKYVKLLPKRALSRSLRIEIAYRQRYACNACQLFPIPPDFQVDHVVALEDGGQDIASNLQALCVSCHSEKTRLNRLRKTMQFASETQSQHEAYQPPDKVFSKYFRHDA